MIDAQALLTRAWGAGFSLTVEGRPMPLRHGAPPPAPPMPQLTFRPPVAVGGPFEEHMARMAANRAVLTDAPDLRSSARRAIDNVWDRLLADCEVRFGRPPLESWEQASDGDLAALNIARNYEGAYLRLAGTPGASPASIDAALDLFCAATASWANYDARLAAEEGVRTTTARRARRLEYVRP